MLRKEHVSEAKGVSDEIVYCTLGDSFGTHARQSYVAQSPKPEREDLQ